MTVQNHLAFELFGIWAGKGWFAPTLVQQADTLCRVVHYIGCALPFGPDEVTVVVTELIFPGDGPRAVNVRSKYLSGSGARGGMLQNKTGWANRGGSGRLVCRGHS